MHGTVLCSGLFEFQLEDCGRSSSVARDDGYVGIAFPSSCLWSDIVGVFEAVQKSENEQLVAGFVDAALAVCQAV